MGLQAEVGGQGLGWSLETMQKKGKILAKGAAYSIVQSQGRKKTYCLNAFPPLSLQEEQLLADVATSLLSQKKPANANKPANDDKAYLRKFFKLYCMQNLIMLERQQVSYLLAVLESQLFGFGPLDLILADDEVEEIAVIGLGKEKPVFVFHKRHGWLASNLFFSSEQHVKDLVNKMARPVGRRLSMNSPILNATLPDGNRLSAAINPISFSGPSLTIRKFRQQPFTPVELVENKTFSGELMAFLWIAMQCDCSLLIAGNTGSGKTSSLNALLSFVPENERIVLVEETPEIRVRHRHFVKLNVVKEQAVGMQELIVESLRMRPDRIVVGEVRSRQEAAAFIDTLLAGQGKGSYATFHGQSAAETVNRMRSLGVLELDLAAIDLVLVQRRWNMHCKQGNKEIRRVVEATELCERNGRLYCNKLFKYDYGKGRLLKENESTKVFEKAKRGFSFEGIQGFKAELKKRARLLSAMEGKGIGMKEFFKRVNKN